MSDRKSRDDVRIQDTERALHESEERFQRLSEAAFEGSVISGHNLKLGEGCVLDGPIVAEHKAVIGTDCTLGSAEHHTTLSARGLKIGRGVIAYGTVWGGDS